MEYKVSRIHMRKSSPCWGELKKICIKQGVWRKQKLRLKWVIEEDLIEELFKKVEPGLRYTNRGWQSSVRAGNNHWRGSLRGTVVFVDEFNWCQTKGFRDGGCGLKCQTYPSLSLLTPYWSPLLMEPNQRQSPCRLTSSTWRKVEKGGRWIWSSQWRISSKVFI